MQKKEYEAKKVQDAIELTRERSVTVQMKEAAEQARADEQSKVTKRAEEQAEAARKSEVTEQGKLDEAKREAAEKNEEANAKFAELQRDIQAKINTLKEILQILGEKHNELAACI